MGEPGGARTPSSLYQVEGGVDGLCENEEPGVKSLSSPSGTRAGLLPEFGAGVSFVVAAILSEAWGSLIALVYSVSRLRL